MHYYLNIAERWFRAKPGNIMRLSDLLRRPRSPYALFILPFLALALAAASLAEPSPPPPSAEATPEATAGQPNADPAAPAPAQPEPKSATTEPEAKSAPAKAGSQILINIDKSRQEMTVFVDGIEKYNWPVSTGKRGYSTPSGNYTATSMNEIWYSKEWDNAPMPHAIFYMKDGHAIHGSLEVKNLGKPASHGCVRISPTNATVLYTLVKENGMENTKVVLAGVTPGGEAKVATQPAYPRYGDAGPPWFGPGPGYDQRYDRPRRGLFGGWFRQQPYGGPQGYYRPPRGYYPRGY
jgi:lipoprotein-anchoring transpeptidase ErfK/SrfK